MVWNLCGRLMPSGSLAASIRSSRPNLQAFSPMTAGCTAAAFECGARPARSANCRVVYRPGHREPSSPGSPAQGTESAARQLPPPIPSPQTSRTAEPKASVQANRKAERRPPAAPAFRSEPPCPAQGTSCPCSARRYRVLSHPKGSSSCANANLQSTSSTP